MCNNSNQAAVAEQQSATTPLKQFNLVLANTKTQEFLRSVLANKAPAFVNNITALVANDAKLQECRPMSLIYAGIKATALDLPLDNNLGFAYVIPYKNNKTNTTEAQFQMGYRGFIQLAERSGQYIRINVGEVYEGQISNYDILSGDLELKGKKVSDTIVGYFAYFRLLNGFEKVLYMTADEVQAHAGRYSQTYSSKWDSVKKSSKWTTDFDAMAKKTVLKLLLSKYGPLSVQTNQITEAIKYDLSVIDEQGQPEYIDNPSGNDALEAEVADRKQALREKQAAAAAESVSDFERDAQAFESSSTLL